MARGMASICSTVSAGFLVVFSRRVRADIALGHNLIHEDDTMLGAFNVTFLESLGYDAEDAKQYGDPMNTRFAAQDYSDEAFTPNAISSAVVSLASLGAYAPASSLLEAESAHYATAGHNGDASSVPFTTTVVPSSSGVGFATSTATASTLAEQVIQVKRTASPAEPTVKPVLHRAQAFRA